MDITLFFCLVALVMIVGFLLGKKIGYGMPGLLKWIIAIILWFIVTPKIGQKILEDVAQRGEVASLTNNPYFLTEVLPAFMLNVGLTAVGIGILFGKAIKKQEKKVSVEEDNVTD